MISGSASAGSEADIRSRKWLRNAMVWFVWFSAYVFLRSVMLFIVLLSARQLLGLINHLDGFFFNLIRNFKQRGVL